MRKPSVPANNLILVALAGLLGILFLSMAAWYGEGRWLAPLDDTYIVLTYARNLVHGQPFRFNPADPPSTGATSALWTLLVSPLTLMGKAEAPLLAVLILLCATVFALTLVMVRHVAASMMPPGAAFAAALAVALNGPFAWGSFCGLETGLMAAGILALWAVWLSAGASRSRRWWMRPLAVSVVLGLVRPEGGPLALVAAGAALATWPSTGSRRPAVAAILAGLSGLAAAVALPLILTGTPMGSGGWAKTGWASPVVPPMVALQDSCRFFVDAMKGVWAGAYPPDAAVGAAGSALAGNEPSLYFPPGALLLFIVGAAATARTPTMVGAAIWMGGFLLSALILPVGWHHHRYLVPLFPPFVIISFAGIDKMAEATGAPWRGRLASTLMAGWILFSVPGLVRHAAFYGHGSESYSSQHLALAERLASSAEPGPVLATDVGILGYFSGARVIDAKGLVTPWVAPAAARGWGSVFDHFKDLPEGERPRLAALHGLRPDVNVEQLVRAGLIVPLASFNHPRGASPLVLYELAWPATGPGPSIKGWRLADEFDAGNPAAEKIHRYRPWMRSPEGIPYNAVQVLKEGKSPIGDGGWVVDGGETFTVRCEPGVAAVIIMRTFVPRPAALLVSVNGSPPQECRLAPLPGVFQTVLVWQDQGRTVRAANTVRVECLRGYGNEYSSFHYWVMQKAPPNGAPGTKP
jgi:hypothetical protein